MFVGALGTPVPLAIYASLGGLTHVQKVSCRRFENESPPESGSAALCVGSGRPGCDCLCVISVSTPPFHFHRLSGSLSLGYIFHTAGVKISAQPSKSNWIRIELSQWLNEKLEEGLMTANCDLWSYTRQDDRTETKFLTPVQVLERPAIVEQLIMLTRSQQNY